MRTFGITPARAGSTRLPNKNMLKMCGKPLIWWTIKAADESHLDHFIVTSNDYAVLRYCKHLGVPIHIRPAKLCTNESNIYETVGLLADLNLDYDRFILLNPTSPLRTADDINAALEIKNHSVISVVEDPGFWWRAGKRLYTPPRGRTQDQKHNYIENGAIFIADRYVLAQGCLAPKNQKNTSLYIMPKERSIDIDTIYDFRVAETTMRELV